jgi:hypothetical protein
MSQALLSLCVPADSLKLEVQYCSLFGITFAPDQVTIILSASESESSSHRSHRIALASHCKMAPKRISKEEKRIEELERKLQLIAEENGEFDLVILIKFQVDRYRRI